MKNAIKWNEELKRWVVNVKVRGLMQHYGTFKTRDEAEGAVEQAKLDKKWRHCNEKD